MHANSYLGCKIGDQLAHEDFSICLRFSSKMLCSQGRDCRALHVIVDFQRLQDHLHNPSAICRASTLSIVYKFNMQQKLAGKTY